jgi:hypothetical protein
MVSIPTVVGVITCGFLLCLGLSNTAQGDYAASAADEMKAGQSVSSKAGLPAHLVKGEEGKQKDVRAIRGEVLRIEHENYFVKQYDGKEVRLHIDEMTQMTGNIGQGERIEAQVNDQNHALSILSAQAAQDRRNDKE